MLFYFLKKTTKTAFLNKRIRDLIWGSLIFYEGLISK